MNEHMTISHSSVGKCDLYAGAQIFRKYIKQFKILGADGDTNKRNNVWNVKYSRAFPFGIRQLVDTAALSPSFQ
jgi:hypothetical protein